MYIPRLLVVIRQLGHVTSSLVQHLTKPISDNLDHLLGLNTLVNCLAATLRQALVARLNPLCGRKLSEKRENYGVYLLKSGGASSREKEILSATMAL